MCWPFIYPWPQRPAGLIETGFDELAKRWRPIFDYCDDYGVDVGFELHPGEDVHDGVTFEMLLERVDDSLYKAKETGRDKVVLAESA